MNVTLTVCTTCKFAAGRAFDDQGRTGGVLLAEALEAEVAGRPNVAKIVRHECLWACAMSCTVLIESPKRTGYLVGRFTPDANAAEALLDWASVYGETEAGQVPYRKWPEGMKGHFIARLPVNGEGTQ